MAWLRQHLHLASSTSTIIKSLQEMEKYRNPMNFSSALFHEKAPWWIHTILIVLFWLGPAAIVASVFMSMWAGWLPSPITDNNKILVRMEAKFDNATVRMLERTALADTRDEHVIRLLLVMCRNLAKNDIDRSQCDNYWRR